MLHQKAITFINVILWQLSCNHQSLAGPESNTNTSKQLRGTVPRIFDALHYDTFTWVSGTTVCEGMTVFELTANSALHLA